MAKSKKKRSTSNPPRNFGKKKGHRRRSIGGGGGGRGGLLNTGLLMTAAAVAGGAIATNWASNMVVAKVKPDASPMMVAGVKIGLGLAAAYFGRKSAIIRNLALGGVAAGAGDLLANVTSGFTSNAARQVNNNSAQPRLPAARARIAGGMYLNGGEYLNGLGDGNTVPYARNERGELVLLAA